MMEISERCFEEAIERAAPARPRRLRGRRDRRARDAAALRRHAAGRLPQAPARGLRPRALPPPARRRGLRPRHAAQGVEEARAAPRRGGARSSSSKRLAAEIERRGALDVLRNGIKDSGCKFRLAYFRPASGLNEETRRLHAANLFAAVRQLRYSTKNENSLDLVLFLNGIPIFTAELKNPLNGQDVEDAIRQYKTDRDPREPLLAYGRCLAHFAVDPDLVYVTTQLAGPEDALPALQPGQVRRRRQPARAAHAAGLRHRLPVGGDLGARQRARPRAPVHPRGRGGGREGAARPASAS